MSESHVIADGQYEPAYISRVRGLYAETRLKFRPMLHAERMAFQFKLGSVPAEQVSEVMAVAIGKYVKEWSVLDASGKPLPIEVEHIRTLRSQLFERIYAVIAGRDGGDPDPLRAPTKQEAEITAESILEGLPVGEARELHDGGN